MAHEPEPPFNPCDKKLQENEQVFACRWELLRRNKQFQAVTKKWVASDSFRKAHALTPDYNDVLVPRCALDWMLTSKQRIGLAKFQIEKFKWKLKPYPNFGPIIYRQKPSVSISRKSIADFVELRRMENAPKPVTLDQAWNKVPEPFKHQFRYAVLPTPLKPAFDSINKTITDTSRFLWKISRYLDAGDPQHEMKEMAGQLCELGVRLHDLSANYQLYRIAHGSYSSTTFKKYLARITADFSGPHGEIYAATKYDRHRSFLGTTEDWHWFLEAEQRGLDIKKSADLTTLAKLYCEDLRQRAMRGKAPQRTKAHGHTGESFSYKVVKNRRATVKRHVLSIQEWIRTEYLPLPPAPSKLVS
jgi:hypothetical protein